MLAREVDAWGIAQQDEFYRQLGAKLLSMWQSCQHPDLIDAAYEVAVDIVGDTGDAAVQLGDDIANDWLHNTIDRYDKGWLIFLAWDGDHPGGGSREGITVLDFGNGAWFLAEPPNPDTGAWWTISSVLDPDDSEALHNAVMNYLYEGLLPDRIQVLAPMTRDDVKRVLYSSLDGRGFADWSTLAEKLSDPKTPTTETERNAALDAYLDAVLSIR